MTPFRPSHPSCPSCPSSRNQQGTPGVCRRRPNVQEPSHESNSDDENAPPQQLCRSVPSHLSVQQYMDTMVDPWVQSSMGYILSELHFNMLISNPFPTIVQTEH